ncbi:MAG: chemotaxis-specific protein-glutamate methyltransferase CheB, partial [Lachnospiraceae bacterium]|nr:chemotaxis-specific protein-glutamate methyltransferase CheB [Lachnospiraceae bacterium]
MKNIFIVDDSALMRRVLSDIINADEELHAERMASDGVEALAILDSGFKPDVIVLDINMPRMNGIEFLRVLHERGQKETVLIVSTLAKEGGKETIEALELGAFDFVTKPTNIAVAKGPSFARKVRHMLHVATGLITAGIDDAVHINEMQSEKKSPQQKAPEKKPVQQMHVSPSVRKAYPTFVSQLRGDLSLHSKEPLGKGANKVVALACSTGGPKALQDVIPYLPSNLDAAVMIVQHMPAGFTRTLAKRLDEMSSIQVKEAEHGEILQKGTVYIAKGGSQMRLIEKSKHVHELSVTVEEARNALKPCADILYESLMESSFDEITCVVLTGMGSDGTQGILQLEKTNKIYVIA